jgi:hypothetical protein
MYDIRTWSLYLDFSFAYTRVVIEYVRVANCVHLSCSVIWYVILALKYAKMVRRECLSVKVMHLLTFKRRLLETASLRVQAIRREIRLTIQVHIRVSRLRNIQRIQALVICVVYWTAGVAWPNIDTVLPTWRYRYVLSNIIWMSTCVINPIVYLTMNVYVLLLYVYE